MVNLKDCDASKFIEKEVGQRRRVGGNGSTDLSAGCLEVSPIPSRPSTISPHLDEFVSSKKNMFAKIVFGFVCRSLFGPKTPKDGSVQTSLGRHHVHHA